MSKIYVWPVVAAASLLLLGIYYIYGVGLRNEFVFDDFRFIDGTLPLDRPYQFAIGFRALANYSFPFIHQVIGPDVAWQRGLNVALHIVNAVLLALLVQRLVRRALAQETAKMKGGSDGANDLDQRWIAAIMVAVIWWAFNPVAVYAVAYLIQRSSLMAVTFALMMLLGFIQALDNKRWYWWLATGMAYGGVLLSKEHAAPIFVVLLPLYIYWCRPDAGLMLRRGVVFGVIAGGIAAVLMWWKGWSIGAATEDMVQPFLRELAEANPEAPEMLFALSVINQMALFFRYGLTWLIPWPDWISIDLRVPFPLTLWSWQLLGAIGYVALVVVSGYLILKRSGRLALVGLALLVPAILFVTELAYVRLQEVFVLYRSYIWSITLPILVALALGSALRNMLSVLVAGLIGSLTMAVLARDRVASFRDNVTVWRDAVEKLDVNGGSNVFGKWRPPLNLSMGLIQQRRYDEALRYAVMADRNKCPLGMAKFNQAVSLINLGQPRAAIELLDMSLQDGFEHARLVYKNRALAHANMKNFEAALVDVDRALAQTTADAEKADLLITGGRIANNAMQYDRALEYYRQAQQLMPEQTSSYIGIAYALHKKGDNEGALKSLNQSLARKPTPEVLHARSYLFLQIGNKQRALADIDTALAMMPGFQPYVALKNQILSGAATDVGDIGSR